MEVTDELEARLREAQRHLDEVCAERDALAAKHDAPDPELEKHAHRVAARQRALDAVRDEVASLEREVAELRDETHRAEAAASDLVRSTE
jgi:chromosome segregation ATPase